MNIQKSWKKYVTQTGEAPTPIENPDDLRATFWPEEEDVDELVATVRRLRIEHARPELISAETSSGL